MRASSDISGFLKGKRIRVHALSHSAQFKKQMNLIRAIGSAIDESVDQSSVLVYPCPESSEVLRAHAALIQRQGDGAVCTIPFLDTDGRGYGALTLERSADKPFQPHEVELFDSLAALAGPILNEKRENDRLLIGKNGISLKAQLERLTVGSYLPWLTAVWTKMSWSRACFSLSTKK